ncbi:MAG: 2-polyprenyl-6-methoxyphenol hydroxylase-like FAD-dependent oxidoreductase [Acidimicrobiales bacterium]|jgi:2-polyprenyl-6-methoxyphenol hydroxylase-like FAD-dependent oxidoreductase
MQYHLEGFRAGDPSVAPVASDLEGNVASPPDEVDVLIVGCGPAGLTLATQLSAFPDLTTRIVDQKLGPLTIGQADGVACRSMEMFEAFGFCERVLKEAYWVNETVFWRPNPAKPLEIARADRVQDVEDGLSEMPHTILSQARVHDFYLDTMKRSARRLSPDYGRRFVDLTVADVLVGDSYPVTATLERVDPGHEGEIETVRARYVVGCDGARSSVRRSLGVALRGDAANKIWGVADFLAVTDFPDIRFKAAIQSASNGSMLIIPREGGYMFRMYTELGELEPGERVSDRNISSSDIIAAAQRVLLPYTLDVKEVAWWSAYEIGQRISDTFDDRKIGTTESQTPRVFITGDACHTHSPKAGQGMNVSMADSFNLGWKLASVIRGTSTPALLDTYSFERQAVAQELIDFDRDMEKLFAARAGAATGSAEDEGVQVEFQNYYTTHARFTAGVETRYGSSLITGHASRQSLATGFTVGTRLHSEAVVRLADAKPVHLGHIIKADGRWRIIAFAASDAPTAPSSTLTLLCNWLEHALDSPVVRYTPPGADPDSIIDVRAVFQQSHRDLASETLPTLLLPRKGRYGLIDYEKAFCSDLHRGADIFDSRGIDRANGCMIVVRPDQHIAEVLRLDGHEELKAFFSGFMT